ncbi:MAG: DUF4838 domain-containing protein [Planctomycetota bacterium]|nr:DUF4838 domain-containing protein [Planctomycetota bacterium]
MEREKEKRPVLTGLMVLISAISLDTSLFPEPVPKATDVLYPAMAEPWTSKGLTPVTLKFKKELGDLVLAADGKAKVKIITADTDAWHYPEIAKLLKTYLDKCTGADFEIVTDRVPSGEHLYIGPVDEPMVKRVFAESQKFKLDGFQVVRFKGGLILSGRDCLSPYANRPPRRLSIYTQNVSRGTLFAVVDLLERFVGMRWYHWGELGECAPDFTRRALSIPPVAYQDAPVFYHRRSTYGNLPKPFGQDAKYMPEEYRVERRRRVLWRSPLMRASSVHMNVANHTDTRWHEVFPDKPHLFALRKDGTRMMGKKGPHSSQRCYSEEEGFNEHIKAIDQWYRGGKDLRLFGWELMAPNKKYILWLPNDGFPGCHCERCSALIDWEAPIGERQMKLIWGYIFKLCAEVKKRWPDKVVTTLLYGGWTKIPTDRALPDNLLLCKVWNSVIEPFMKEERYWKQNIDELDVINKYSKERMLIWSHYPIKPYQITFEPMPFNAPHILKRIYSENRNKIAGVVLNGGYVSMAQNGQALYLYYKLLWNPDFDVDGELDEFCRLQFGPAAGEMKKFFTLGIDRWEKTRWSYLPEGLYKHVERLPRQLYWKETYPPEIRKEMQELLAEAVAKTRAGSMYHVKTKYYRDAHRPFFELGEFKDDIRRVTFACPRANPISVDGDLTEWKDMSPLLMRDNATGEDVKAKTEIFTAHDRDKFYVAGRVHEVGKVVLPPTRVPRDGDIYSYDSIEVYFCTDQERFDEAGVAKLDQHHLFMVNARGEFLDGYKSTGDRHAIRKVNFDVEYDVKPLGRGFQFEMAFPYKAIHALAPQPGDFWYINFYRNRPRDDDSPRYHAFAPTKSAFSNTSRFAVMEFPKKVLLLYDFKDKNPEFSVWKKPSPEAVCAHEIKDGIACLKVKYPKTAKKNGRITFSISPGAPKVDKPFQSHYRFRYRGQGVNSITFHLRSIGWAQQNVKYTPLHPAEEKVDIKEWQTVVGDRTYQYVKGNQEFPTHPSDINRIGIGLDMIPGADVVIELDEIRIVEK